MLIIITVFDTRLGAIPIARATDQRGLHYRRFGSGIASMSVFTADDMTALIQQMPFAVGTGTTVLKSRPVATAFVTACRISIRMLMVLKMRSVDERYLLPFEDGVKEIGEHLEVLVEAIPVAKKRPTLSVPKIHSLAHLT